MKKKIYIVLFMTSFILSCSNLNNKNISTLDTHDNYYISGYKEFMECIEDVSIKQEIIDHIPLKIKRESIVSGHIWGCSNGNCNGVFALTLKIDSTTVKEIRKKDFKLVCSASSTKIFPFSHILITDSESLDTITHIDFEETIITFDFSDINFYVENIDESKVTNVKNNNLSYKEIDIPKDLTVYIIDYESGNFWKNDCTETRNEALGKWKHGYSRGYAISEKYMYCTYWLVVW